MYTSERVGDGIKVTEYLLGLWVVVALACVVGLISLVIYAYREEDRSGQKTKDTQATDG